VDTQPHAVMHAGADIDQPIRSFDQCRQDVGREHIDREDAGNSGLGLHAARLAVTDARIVDYGVEATELIDLACSGRRCGDGGKPPGDSSLGAGCRSGASRLRPSLRPCRTTSCPCSIRSLAAMRPRPSDDPVINTLAMPRPLYQPEHAESRPSLATI